MSSPENHHSDKDAVFAPGVRLPVDRIQFRFSRSSGPGGQCVNKVSSRAELRVQVADIEGLDELARGRLRRIAGRRLTRADEIVIHSDTYRSQRDNRRACLERLRCLVVESLLRPKKRRVRRPSRSMIEKRLAAKRIRGEKKQRRRWRDDS